MRSCSASVPGRSRPWRMIRAAGWTRRDPIPVRLGLLRADPRCFPWEALLKHVQVDQGAALGAVEKLRRLPTADLLGRLC